MAQYSNSKISRRAYLNLIKSIGLSDFKVKYNDSFLGYLWSLAKPLMLFSILYVVFTKFIKVGANVPYYSLQLLLGIITWSYFAEATVSSMNSVVNKGALLRKIYFPREIIVVASSLTSFMTMILNLAVMPVFLVIKNVPVDWQVLWVTLLLAELFMFTIGLSLLLAALYVKFRDIGHIWEVSLQGLFYATPILYVPDIIPERFRSFIILNPMAQIIQDLRQAMITPTAMTAGDILPGVVVIAPYAIATGVLVLGIWYFKKTSKNFAEEV